MMLDENNRNNESYIMYIYEKIFARLEELHMSQIELSRRTGIATSTISDWRKKKINPQADKLVVICKALDMSLVELLCDEEDKQNEELTANYILEDRVIIEGIVNAPFDIKRRIISYYEQLLTQNINPKANNISQNRSISIIRDEAGKSIALINDIRFKSRRSIDWNEIENYLKQYVGECFEILETAETVYIGTDFPDEYAHSKDTKNVKGVNEKAKANAITAVGELLEIATGKTEFPDYNNKHGNRAKYGWYRYTTRFGIPVYSEDGVLERYNIFRARILVRRDEDGKLYLYDVVTIKKETSKPLES
ncbi:MAG: helix-turn-helix domain-containing protein [Lachnospiraceae bacterium]